jgi:hypothetical protein
MKSRISQSIAALFVAGAASIVYPQTAAADSGTPVPPPPPVVVSEPIASVSKADDAANAIAQALTADASMQGSKITVQPEEAMVLLTGVTATEAQRVKATQIAAAQSGGKPVVNAISASEVVIQVPDPKPGNEVPADEAVDAAAAQPEAAVPPQPETARAPQPETTVQPKE